MGNCTQQIGPQRFLPGTFLNSLLFPCHMILFKCQCAFIKDRDHQVFSIFINGWRVVRTNTDNRPDLVFSTNYHVKALVLRPFARGIACMLTVPTHPFHCFPLCMEINLAKAMIIFDFMKNRLLGENTICPVIIKNTVFQQTA